MTPTETRCECRYRVVAVLGRSHYSVVDQALDTKAREHVAVKVLSLAGTHLEIAETMFRKEVGALAGSDSAVRRGVIVRSPDPGRDAAAFRSTVGG